MRFLNLHLNLARFRKDSVLYFSKDKESVPISRMREIFLQFFRSPDVRPFLEGMADQGAQGYFRPFTLDEEESIGVTFPKEPGIRGAFCSYERYLGEPFNGAVVPTLVRAVGVNGTGCLKLGSNYLLSVAVQVAQSIDSAPAAFFDDRPDKPLESERSQSGTFMLFDCAQRRTNHWIPDGPLIYRL